MSIKSSYPNIKPSINIDFAKSKTLDGRCVFQRNSGATYVDENGDILNVGDNQARFEHITNYRYNYLKYSEQFQSWINANVSTVSNATAAPDGSLTADKIVEDSATNTSHIVYLNSGNLNLNYSSFVYVFSVYAKAAEKSTLTLRLDDSVAVQHNVAFDLSTGRVINESNSTGSIEYVGNGWYRCINVMTSGSGIQNAVVHLLSGVNNNIIYDGDGSSGLYLWGAQLERGTSATDYIQSGATAPAKVSETICKGLLLEETRTNLLPYSAADTTNWTELTSNTTETQLNLNALGQFSGVEVKTNTGLGWHRLGTGYVTAVTQSTEYTATFYYRTGTSGNARLQIRSDVDMGSNNFESLIQGRTDGSDWNYIQQDVGTISDIVTTLMADGLTYKTSYKFVPSASFNVSLAIGPASGGANDTIIALGAQFEVGGFPTSYIPTTGSSATRQKDHFHVKTTDFDWNRNVNDFSILLDVDSDVTAARLYDGSGVSSNACLGLLVLWTDAGGFDDRISLSYPHGGAGTAQTRAFASGNGLYAITYFAWPDMPHRIATSWHTPKYDSNARQWNTCINGDNIYEANRFANGPVPDIDLIGFGDLKFPVSTTNTGEVGRKFFKNLTIYPYSMSNQELRTFTK